MGMLRISSDVDLRKVQALVLNSDKFPLQHFAFLAFLANIVTDPIMLNVA